MSFQIIRNENEETFDVIWTAQFVPHISILDTVRVLQLIADTLSGSVAAKLFEGLPAVEITESQITLRFRFSNNPDHIRTVEHAIGRSELAYHRTNFTFYVLAVINQQFKLDDSLPPGFEETLNMPDYIR
jgi:hypothetical protein